MANLNASTVSTNFLASVQMVMKMAESRAYAKVCLIISVRSDIATQNSDDWFLSQQTLFFPLKSMNMSTLTEQHEHAT